jgi:hypothetical protein
LSFAHSLSPHMFASRQFRHGHLCQAKTTLLYTKHFVILPLYTTFRPSTMVMS